MRCITISKRDLRGEMVDSGGVMKKDLSKFEFDPTELDGFTIEQLRCSACSGYGNCGFRMYRLIEGEPVLLCQNKKNKLTAERERNQA